MKRLQRILLKPKQVRRNQIGGLNWFGATSLDGASAKGSHQSWMLTNVCEMKVFQVGEEVLGNVAYGTNVERPVDSTFAVEEASMRLEYRNNSNNECQVRVYQLWPKRDITVGQLGYVVGDPSGLGHDVFDAVPNVYTPAGSIIAHPYWPQTTPPFSALNSSTNDNQIRAHNHEWNPYLDDWFTSAFRIKLVKQHKLKPGDGGVIKMAKRPFMFSKKKFFGMRVNQDTSVHDYVAMRRFPLLLIGVRGCLGHDETLAEALNAQPIGNISFKPVYVDFGLDWTIQRKYQYRANIGNLFDSERTRNIFGNLTATAAMNVADNMAAMEVNQPAELVPNA